MIQPYHFAFCAPSSANAISVSAHNQTNFAPEARQEASRILRVIGWGKTRAGCGSERAISNWPSRTSVVMETLNVSGMDEMLTLYSVDGDGITSRCTIAPPTINRICARGAIPPRT